jgi:hypothetical protein
MEQIGTEKILSGITGVSLAIGAILGYLVKLRWSREFEKTMEARVLAAQEAVKTAQDLSATNIAAHFKSLKEYYELEITFLNGRLDKILQEKDKKDLEVADLEKQVGSERALREVLEKEGRIYEKEINYLKLQISELKRKGAIAEEASELMREEPYTRQAVENQLLIFRGDRGFARSRHQRAQKGAHRSVATYMNAQAEARVKAEEQAEKSVARRAHFSDSD